MLDKNISSRISSTELCILLKSNKEDDDYIIKNL